MLGKFLQGRYQVVKVLSVGGLCQTYTAQDHHRPGNPICVVKHLKPVSNHPQAVATLRRLFTREAQALKKLDNYDQVPEILAHFEEDLEFYLVQDFIVGHPLSAELKTGHCWSENQVIQLLQEVLSILEFVHSQGLIHRDIKPSNLIRRQQNSKLVLIDFGSVKQVWTQVVTVQGQTNTAMAIDIPATIAMGTPDYMSPEQGRGRPRFNSDIYALGIIGIQALTGINPTHLPKEPDTDEIIWQHQVQVNPRLASVLKKMVRYHFKDRYQSATEALQALQALVSFYTPTHHLPCSGQPSTQLEAAKLSVTSTPTPQASFLEEDNMPICLGNSPKQQVGSHRSDAVSTSLNKSALMVGVGIGVAFILALTLGSYYSLHPLVPASKAQNPVSNFSNNTSSGNAIPTNAITE